MSTFALRQCGTLDITIHSVQKIATQKSMVVDPYVSFWVLSNNGKEIRNMTSVVKKNNDPSFEEEFKIKIFHPEALVLFELWEKTPMQNEIIGSCQLSLSELRKMSEEQSNDSTSNPVSTSSSTSSPNTSPSSSLIKTNTKYYSASKNTIKFFDPIKNSHCGTLKFSFNYQQVDSSVNCRIFLLDQSSKVIPLPTDTTLHLLQTALETKMNLVDAKHFAIFSVEGDRPTILDDESRPLEYLASKTASAQIEIIEKFRYSSKLTSSTLVQRRESELTPVDFDVINSRSMTNFSFSSSSGSQSSKIQTSPTYYYSSNLEDGQVFDCVKFFQAHNIQYPILCFRQRIKIPEYDRTYTVEMAQKHFTSGDAPYIKKTWENEADRPSDLFDPVRCNLMFIEALWNLKNDNYYATVDDLIRMSGLYAQITFGDANPSVPIDANALIDKLLSDKIKSSIEKDRQRAVQSVIQAHSRFKGTSSIVAKAQFLEIVMHWTPHWETCYISKVQKDPSSQLKGRCRIAIHSEGINLYVLDDPLPRVKLSFIDIRSWSSSIFSFWFEDTQGRMFKFQHPQGGEICKLLKHYVSIVVEQMKTLKNSTAQAKGSGSTISIHNSTKKKGFLTKQGGRFATWKRRWFILSVDKLEYYESKRSATNKKPLKSIPLDKIDAVNYIDPESPPDKKAMKKLNQTKINCAFKIESVDRVFYAFADSESERDEWMDAISMSVEQQRQRDSRVVYSGALLKKGRAAGKNPWRIRWFVLTANKLLYFLDERMTSASQKGSVPISDISSIQMTDSEFDKPILSGLNSLEKALCFKIVTRNQRTFHLQATSQNLLEQWLNALKQVGCNVWLSAGLTQSSLSQRIESDFSIENNLDHIDADSTTGGLLGTVASSLGDFALGPSLFGSQFAIKTIATKDSINLPHHTATEPTTSEPSISSVPIEPVEEET